MFKFLGGGRRRRWVSDFGSHSGFLFIYFFYFNDFIKLMLTYYFGVLIADVVYCHISAMLVCK
jgi:hypothetical protein